MKRQCKESSIVGLAILLWGVNLFAKGPDTLWTSTYGGTDYDWVSSIQQTSEGAYIIAGCTQSFGAGGMDVYFVKIGLEAGVEDR